MIAKAMRAALVHEYNPGCLSPVRPPVYLVRTEMGIPRLVIRLRTLHPIFASVC